MLCNIYEPREDSTLLEKYVRQYAKGSVLDMGTGSGIQAITAAHNAKVKSVLATDIQKSAIDYCKKNIKNKKIKFLISDLFENIKSNKKINIKKFDTIVFNPPYLPQEFKLKDLTIEGGKKGYEVIQKFLSEVNGFLKPDGVVLIVFSSLTNKEKVDKFIKKNLLEFELLEKWHYFFEDLYVYKIKKSEALRELEKHNIRNLKYFAKGKRGIVFTGTYKGKKVGVKITNPESKAVSRIDNEINFLKILNKKNIGQKFLFRNKIFFVYEFIEGCNILEFLNLIKGKKIIIKIIKNILNQLFAMDKLKINKEEMSHPIKHVIINKKNMPILIDFERCRYTIKPANITQFCDFLISKNMLKILKNNNIKIDSKIMIDAAKEYKKQQNKNNFKSIKNISTGCLNHVQT